MLKSAVKELAGSLGYDILCKNQGGSAHVTRGIVARFEHQGHSFTFFVQNEWDYIQTHHLKGQFYEPEELSLIARHFDGGVFVDVGANIGNHTIYALRIMMAETVIAFEPNPAAIDVLRVNLALNGVTDRVDHRPLGLSDREGGAKLVAPKHSDLGSTRLSVSDAPTSDLAADAGACPVTTGDRALAEIPRISMIKIDTEAMEMQVLDGLRATLARCRPKLFVEVDDTNAQAFLSFLDTHGYEVSETHRRYATNCNYLAVPKT